MGKKKGFTLIELLAVLVILATILAISMPKILDTRDGSKRKAFKNDVDEIQGIAQLEYNNTKEARYYTFKDGVQTNENGEADKLEFKGDNPSDGYLKIYPNGDVEYYLKNKDRTLCARKEVGDRKGQIVKCENSNNKITLDLKLKTSTNSIRVIAYPKIGEANAIIDTYYYQLNDGKIITSNKASHLFENLKRTKNGNLINYKVNVKVCTKKGICESTEMTTPLDDIKEIDHKIISEPDKIPGGWSLTKTIIFTYPEIKNVGGQSIGKNEISTDGGTTFKIYRGSITVNKDTTFVARITDGTNTKSSISVLVNKFDHEGPNITRVTGNPDKWTNKDVTLTVNATDSKSGLADAAYSFDGGTTWQKENSKTYKSNTNGIVIKVKDKVGNISTYPVIAITKIDKTAPTCSWSGDTNVAPNAWTNQNRSISVSCNDLGGSNCNVNTLNKSWLFNTGTTRTTDLSYEIKDNAGNATVCSKTANVFVDKTPPTCISSGGSASWTNKDITLTGNCSDEGGSGCKDNVIRTISSDTNSTTESPGTVYDNAGNAKECPSDRTVMIDKTPPTCTSSGGSDAWTSGSRTLVGTCSDTGGSGCRGNASWFINWQGNWTNLSPGKVYDNAGNSTDCPADRTVRIGRVADIEYSIYVGDTNENTVLTENNGSLGGTVGKSTPISNMKLKIGAKGISGGVSYLAHRETYGDEKSAITEENKMSTSLHGVKRMEKVKIWLTGDLADAFDIYYRVHVQSFGWLKPVSNGEWTGSSGLCIRIEAIEIQIVPKKSGQPSFNNAGSNVSQNVSIISGVSNGPNDRCPKPTDPPAPTPNCKTCEYWSTCYNYYYNDSAGSCEYRKGDLLNATAFGSGTCRVPYPCKKRYTCCS